MIEKDRRGMLGIKLRKKGMGKQYRSRLTNWRGLLVD